MASHTWTCITLPHRCASQSLLIRQQGCPLAVLAHNLSPGERITTEEPRHTDGERKNEEEPADCKSKDPLQLKDRELAEELSNTGGYKN